MSGSTSECHACKREISGLTSYREFGGLRPCRIKEGENYRDSVEPYYKDEIELCYPCYRSYVIRDQRRQKELEQKAPAGTEEKSS